MKKVFIISAAVSLALGLLLWQARPDGLLHVYFLDVGQGDAILMRTPSGYNILIDGGAGNTVLTELKDVLPFFDNNLDYVILTHPDRDHLEGLVYVLQRYPVERLIFTGVGKNNSLLKKLMKAVQEKNIPVIVADAESDIFLKDGVTIDILFPFSSLMGQDIETNASSIVARAIYGENEILLTGDAEFSIENALIQAKTDINSDILKVAHHGSKYASSENFLRAVAPRYCVISVGKDNSYNHPNPEALERLSKYCKKIMRTDKEGRLEFTVSKDNI